MYHYVTLSRLMPRMQSFQEYRERPMDPVLGSVRPRGRWAAGWIGGIGGSVAVDSLRWVWSWGHTVTRVTRLGHPLRVRLPVSCSECSECDVLYCESGHTTYHTGSPKRMQSSRQMCQRESQHIKVESWFVVFMSFHVPVDMQSPKPAGIQTGFIAIFRPNPRSSKVASRGYGQAAMLFPLKFIGQVKAEPSQGLMHLTPEVRCVLTPQPASRAHVTSPKTCETWLIDVDWWWLHEVVLATDIQNGGLLGASTIRSWSPKRRLKPAHPLCRQHKAESWIPFTT